MLTIVHFCTDCGNINSDDRVWFCCKDHLKLHKIDHETNCFPYRVSNGDEERGRCLVATRDIQAGEVIFVEEPITVGPLHDTKPVCLGCLAEVKYILKLHCDFG